MTIVGRQRETRLLFERHFRGVLGRWREACGDDAVAALADDACEMLLRPAKRLRPMLYLGGREVFGGTGVTAGEAALEVASALELLHGFILVHDDLIDRSDERRGAPTMQRMCERRLAPGADRARVGANLALVVGDLLFAFGQKVLIESGCPGAGRMLGKLLEYILETGWGEASDIVYGARDVSKVELREVERMYLRKTTRYSIEAPLALAAVEFGWDDARLRALEAVTTPAGLAFQMLNDLDEFARSEVSDGAMSSDLQEGKKTYLVLSAFGALGSGDRSMLQLCLNGIPPSEATRTKVRELVVKSGAVGRARRRAEGLLREGLAAVDRLPVGAEGREMLKGMFEGVAEQLTGERVMAGGREVAA